MIRGGEIVSISQRSQHWLSWLETQVVGVWLLSLQGSLWTLQSLASRWESVDTRFRVSLASAQLPVARLLVFSIIIILV